MFISEGVVGQGGTSMTRTTPTDWLDAGLAILATDGPEAVTIDELCSRLDVTKGSFYHHFDGYADYETRLLEHFETEGTQEIIETVESEPTSEAKLYRLLDVVVAASRQAESDPELAIRAWAQQDEAVRAVQERVDDRRIAYLRSLTTDIVDDDRADSLATLLYAALVGCEQLHPPLRGDQVRSLFDEILRGYGLPPTDHRDGPGESGSAQTDGDGSGQRGDDS